LEATEKAAMLQDAQALNAAIDDPGATFEDVSQRKKKEAKKKESFGRGRHVETAAADGNRKRRPSAASY
jgi:hypothetical protein